MRFLFLFVFILTGAASRTQPKYFDQGCDASKLPVVFVHGFLGSGDNWATQMQRFSSNGYCNQRMFVFDWNSITRSKSTDSLLNVFIDEVMRKTKSKQVDLIGHSAGGGLCYNYLNDSLHALKVAHYIHIGSGKMKTAAGKNAEVKTMNIYSKADMVVKTGGDIAGATNIMLTNADHMQVATSEETFVHLYQFFNNNQRPKTTKIISPHNPNSYVTLSGKGVTLGENNPLSLDSFNVYIFNPATGKRNLIERNVRSKGAYTGWTKFAKDGSFGFAITTKSYFEFEVRPKNGRKIYYFFEPLKRTDKAVYLRAFPSAGMIAGVLNQIPKDEKQTVLVIFSSNNAIIAGKDTSAIDSIPLSTPLLAPASKTMIAAFLFDDGDGKTSVQPLKNFGGFPFLGSADVFIPADANGTMRIYYNGRTMVLPRRPSSDGVMIAVFQAP
ncbi:MAG: alpha/beta fold hydrolase [Chitinophagaceae bacterium]|nr:alpha/beta fold hydrolase [Chitinophagaceae bacterium]